MSVPSVVEISSGIIAVDAAFGPIRVGTLWAFVGMRGVGISQLALRYARTAAESGHLVTLANGHLPPDVLQRRLHLEGEAASRLDARDWFGLPGREASNLWNTTVIDRSDLVVYDTVDEMFPADSNAQVGRLAWRSALRDLRSFTRATHKATLITARIAPTSASLRAVRKAWRRHPTHEAVMDAADVVITVVDGTRPRTLTLIAESRLQRDRSITLDMNALFPHPAATRVPDATERSPDDA